MTIEAVDITTAPTIFYAKRAFQLAGGLKRLEPGMPESKVEVYSTHGYLPGAGVTTKKIREWMNQYEAEVVRIHLPWMSSPEEIWHQTFFGNWYGTPKDQLMNVIAMRIAGPATNEHGLHLAAGLGVGAILHPNIAVGLHRRGILQKHQRQGKIPFYLGETSVAYNTPEPVDQDALSDPVATITKVVEPLGLNGFMLPVDHLLGIVRGAAELTRQERVKLTDQVIEMINHPKILEHTWAMHIAATGHRYFDKDDDLMGQILQSIRQASWKRPVRVALDFFDPQFFLTSSHNQLRLLQNARELILR